jgi:hypothetical protein
MKTVLDTWEVLLLGDVPALTQHFDKLKSDCGPNSLGLADDVRKADYGYLFVSEETNMAKLGGPVTLLKYLIADFWLT